MLIVDKISKKFGEHIAIDNLSFSAKKGEVIGLVGHNGSGKSTTMKIISDCLKPDEGAVYINNVCVETSPIEAKKQIGYLPEIPPLYFDMTIEEQLKFACGLRGIPYKMQDSEIKSVCEVTHISGSQKRLIGNLSKGYRQRVGLAQSLIGGPELLLLDEPTVGLDPKQMMEFRELLLSLKEKHIIIYSTHILSEISMISDRIISLSNGEITADDTLKNLKDKFSEYREYRLCADGNKEDIFTLIKEIDGVKDVFIEDDGESSYFVIKTVKNIEIYKILFFKLASNNYPIKSFTEMNMSLEKLFMHLTEDRR